MAWLFFAEPLVQAILGSHRIDSHAGRFLPLSSTFSIFNDNKGNASDHMLSHTGGIVVLCGWLALVTIVAVLLLKRRDVS